MALGATTESSVARFPGVLVPKADTKAGAFMQLRCDADGTAFKPDAFVDADKAEAVTAAIRGRDIEPATIVPDRQFRRVRKTIERDLGTLGIRVPHNVAQGFLRHAVKTQ